MSYRFRTVCATRLLPLLLLLPAAVQAQYNYSYNNDGTITITGYTGSVGAVTIPSTINGVPVTSIEGVSTFLGGFPIGAFENCANLTSVTIPNSVTSIGGGAFEDCISLTSISIPADTTSIGYNVFADCTNLISVYFQGNAPSVGEPIVFDAGVGSDGVEDDTNPAFAGDSKATVYYLPCATGWGTTFGGCPTALWANPPDGTVTVTANPSQGGSAMGSGTYPACSSQQLSATVNSGWQFTGWSDGGAQTHTITVLSGEITLTANFSQQTAMVNVQASPSNGGTVSGGGLYASGTNVTVCATPNPGYEFVDWSGTATPICLSQACPQYILNLGVVSTSACYTFTANMNYNLMANFAPTNTPPPVTITYVFTNTPLWDVSGIYTNNTVTNDVVIADIQQQANGKIIGVRTETYVVGDAAGENSNSISGQTFVKSGTVGARLSSRGNISGVENGVSYIAPFKSRETAVIVPSTLMVIDTGSIRVCIVGERCTTTTEGFELPLPHGMNGDWSLSLNTTTQGSKVTGSATITLYNGRALSYAGSGTYNTHSRVAKLHLVGTGDAVGSSLTVTTQGAGMDLVALTGRVLGQTLTVK